MKSLRVGYSTYDYALGEVPKFKVSAKNARGFGPESVENATGASL